MPTTIRVPNNLHIKIQNHPGIRENIIAIAEHTGMTLAVQIVAAALHDYARNTAKPSVKPAR